MNGWKRSRPLLARRFQQALDADAAAGSPKGNNEAPPGESSVSTPSVRSRSLKRSWPYRCLFQGVLQYNQSVGFPAKLEHFALFPPKALPQVIANLFDLPPDSSQTPSFSSVLMLAYAPLRGRGAASIFMVLLLCLGGLSGSTPRSLAAAEPSFERDILPIMTRLGCNSAACHGSASGRGGFKLSLFGSRAADDYQSLVFGDAGRRLHLAFPTRSLLLKKPTETLDHEGGFHFDVDSEIWQLWIRWIEAGAPYGEPLDLKKIEVTPATVRGDVVPYSQPLTVWAIASDGRRTDVTRWAEFLSPDPARIQVDELGTVTLQSQGEATLVIRYAGQFASVPILIPFRKPTTTAPLPNHRLDVPLVQKLNDLGLAWPEPESTSRQLRRVYLDLLGRHPTEQEQRDFESSTAPDRWERVVDRLLASEEMNRYWAYQWSNWFRIAAPAQEPEVARQHRLWLKERLAEQTSWPEVVSAQIQAAGDSHQIGAAAFYRATQDPRLQAERFSEIVLGVRLRCANCHDHPLDHWTQDDYHGLAAIFAKVRYGRHIEPLERGKVIHPLSSAPAVPQIPGHPATASADLTRDDLAAWLRNEGQIAMGQYFVNRVWYAMTGHGMVFPLDDWRTTNPPTHPKLLAALMDQSEREHWRLRPLLRSIALTRTYQTASTPPGVRPDDFQILQRYLGVQRPRSMSPEVLMDAVVDIFEVVENVEDEPETRRAIELLQTTSTTESLTLLGRCTDPGGCQDPAGATALDLRSALHWINGEVINRRLNDPAGWLRQSWQQETDRRELIDAVYRRILCRAPTEAESQFWLNEINSAPQVDTQWQLFQDLTWGILSSSEFLQVP